MGTGRIVRYDAVAAEYYDENRHPTSANFREASARVLESWLDQIPRANGLSCEVGAGDSLWAELLVRRGESLRDFIVTDASFSMLRHSEKWEAEGLRSIVSRAEELPLCDGSLNLLISSLGDPYNEPAFWREVSRVLRPGSRCLYTTPSYEWAMAFREGKPLDEIMAAEFELSDGRIVLVRSWIYSISEQVRLIEAYDLTVVEVVQLSRSALAASQLSWKLIVDGDRDLDILTGYVVAKGLTHEGRRLIPRGFQLSRSQR
jgi:SAM-dependent methyltransferase